MPKQYRCQVLGCDNKLWSNSDRTQGPTFFIIPNGKRPEKRDLAIQWLAYIGRGDDVDKYNFSSGKKICEKHFHPDWFTDDRHIRMCKELGLPPKYTKCLKAGAIPGPVGPNTCPLGPDPCRIGPSQPIIGRITYYDPEPDPAGIGYVPNPGCTIAVSGIARTSFESRIQAQVS